jgi:hypothetical protein
MWAVTLIWRAWRASTADTTNTPLHNDVYALIPAACACLALLLACALYLKSCVVEGPFRCVPCLTASVVSDALTYYVHACTYSSAVFPFAERLHVTTGLGVVLTQAHAHWSLLPAGAVYPLLFSGRRGPCAEAPAIVPPAPASSGTGAGAGFGTRVGGVATAAHTGGGHHPGGGGLSGAAAGAVTAAVSASPPAPLSGVYARFLAARDLTGVHVHEVIHRFTVRHALLLLVRRATDLRTAGSAVVEAVFAFEATRPPLGDVVALASRLKHILGPQSGHEDADVEPAAAKGRRAGASSGKRAG